MTQPQWEEIIVPRGAYIGWGTKPGQHVTGRVTDYQPAGGQDFNGEPCPQISIELTEKAASFNKDGERSDFDAGELVVLNAGQVSLRRALRAADPSPGDLIKVIMSNLGKTAKGNPVKEFDIKIARGAGGPAKAVENGFDDPPF